METFSDETITGEEAPEMRGLFRATISARVTDDDLNWFRRFVERWMPNGVEPKCAVVFPVIEANWQARIQLETGLASATIVIVDFAWFFEMQAAALAKAFGLKREDLGVPPNMDRAGIPAGVARRMLDFARQATIRRSSLGEIAGLVADASRSAGAPVGEIGDLFDRAALRSMGEGEFQELVARFGAALGDVLDPRRQASVFEASFAGASLIPDGVFERVLIGDVIGEHRTFDVGRARAFAELKSAHESVAEMLRRASDAAFGRMVRPGRIREEDSKRLHGLQIADLAAGTARVLYERHPNDRRAGADAVRRHFDRVLFNTEWV